MGLVVLEMSPQEADGRAKPAVSLGRAYVHFSSGLRNIQPAAHKLNEAPMLLALLTS